MLRRPRGIYLSVLVALPGLTPQQAHRLVCRWHPRLSCPQLARTGGSRHYCCNAVQPSTLAPRPRGRHSHRLLLLRSHWLLQWHRHTLRVPVGLSRPPAVVHELFQPPPPPPLSLLQLASRQARSLAWRCGHTYSITQLFCPSHIFAPPPAWSTTVSRRSWVIRHVLHLPQQRSSRNFDVRKLKRTIFACVLHFLKKN